MINWLYSVIASKFCYHKIKGGFIELLQGTSVTIAIVIILLFFNRVIKLKHFGVIILHSTNDFDYFGAG